MYKVALLEAEHWHVLGHMGAIKKYPEVQVVALSGTGEFTRRLSEDNQIKRYANYLELLDNEKELDFVYIFGIYRESPQIMLECIRRGIPFMADKPCCEEAEQLLPVLQELKRTGLKHCISLQRRFAQPIEKYRDFVREQAKNGGVHIDLHYITGTPQRYETMGFPWANKKSVARGGATLNLAIHYIDLVQYLTDDEVIDAHGVINCNVWGLGLDDYGALLLKTRRGNTAVIEVGYTKSGYPQEDFIFSGKNFYITCTAAQKMQKYALVEGGDARGELVEEEDFEDIQFFDRCLGSMLDHLNGTGKPVAQLEDAYRAVKWVSKIYKDNNF